jgi:hypothetical protein
MNYPEYEWMEGAYVKKGESMVRHVILDCRDEPFPDPKVISEADIYTSIFRYADVNAVTEKHWKGKAIGDFFVDIDASNTDNLKDALLFTRKFLSELNTIVPYLYIKCRFSGAKGFHIETPFEAFGAKPSNMIHLYWKFIARVIAERTLGRPLMKGEKIIDMGRYSIRQLWRLTNTVNLKTGLYKIPLYPKEIMELSIADITELARSPRTIGEETCPGIIESAQKLYQQAMKFHAGITWWMQK